MFPLARVLVPLLAAALLALPAIAQTVPGAPAASSSAAVSDPAANIKLSDILARIEAEDGFIRFGDIEWDERDAQWEIEYQGTNGRKVSVAIKGTTGEPVMN